LKYGIERKVGSIWEMVRPPTAPPYEFESKAEAETMARILYPELFREGLVIRVKPVETA
jgi:hypothetical protein